jgi:hypothetical protein
MENISRKSLRRERETFPKCSMKCVVALVKQQNSTAVIAMILHHTDFMIIKFG